MNALLKKIIAFTLILGLMLCLPGCKALDYRNAIAYYNNGQYLEAAGVFETLEDYQESDRLLRESRYYAATELYNAGAYEEAAKLYLQLGAYQDSQALHARCGYNRAVAAMDAGDYPAAITLFEDMLDFEDAAQRNAECHYQLAIADFLAQDYAAAEEKFLELGEYRLCAEYLRQISWQSLFDWLTQPLETTLEQQIVRISADPETQQLVFYTATEREESYTFTDELILLLPRDTAAASFTGISTFYMDYPSGKIGTEQESRGLVDITGCRIGSDLAVQTYEKTGTDHHSQAISSQDPAESTMYPAMQDNLDTLLEVIPQLLAENGSLVTLAQIGFAE